MLSFCFLLLSDHSPIAATFELSRVHIPNSPQLMLDSDECVIRFTGMSTESLRGGSGGGGSGGTGGGGGGGGGSGSVGKEGIGTSASTAEPGVSRTPSSTIKQGTVFVVFEASYLEPQVTLHLFFGVLLVFLNVFLFVLLLCRQLRLFHVVAPAMRCGPRGRFRSFFRWCETASSFSTNTSTSSSEPRLPITPLGILVRLRSAIGTLGLLRFR